MNKMKREMKRMNEWITQEIRKMYLTEGREIENKVDNKGKE
jgi:hypothetical protein